MENSEELLHFLDTCPTPYHAVSYMESALIQDGFRILDEHSIWQLEPGRNYAVTRGESALIAFRIPEGRPQGFMIGASHDDSPALKIKPEPELEKDGLVRLNVEGYGGLLHAPWFDRPLTIAGRVCVKTPSGIQSRRIHIDRDLCIIPSLAIHLDRTINTQGHEFKIQKEMLPVFRTSDDPTTFNSLLAKELGVSEEDILSHDLIVCPHTKASLLGADCSMISAPHLDDLQCTFANLKGFQAAGSSDSIPVLAVFDTEEVGSTSPQGANSTFLEETLSRIAECLHMSRNEYFACLNSSFVISADNAHAAHPNYAEKMDLTSRPRMNGGVVIKHAASLSYLTDAVSSALVEDLCQRKDIPVQHFANHSDIRGGGTLGKFCAAHLGIRTVDLGLAQLAMHSPCETAGARDTAYLTDLFTAFYSSSLCRDDEGTMRFVSKQ